MCRCTTSRYQSGSNRAVIGGIRRLNALKRLEQWLERATTEWFSSSQFFPAGKCLQASFLIDLLRLVTKLYRVSVEGHS